MPACPRSEIVLEGESGYYHVWTRCVRRSLLCGRDPVTGKNFEHRRQWIRDYLPQICELFAVDASFHVEMQNHLHLVIRTCPDVVKTWSDEDVVRRWLMICRLIRSKDGVTIEELTDARIAKELAKPGRVEELRRKLSSVSEFMKALCEHLARRANREDKIGGAFFESRFKCRRIENEGGILVCGMYIDLNQIRAGEVLTPETSTHTSAYDRIVAREERARNVDPAKLADSWLSELFLDPRSDAYQVGPQPSATGKRASDKGLLSINLDEYLQLLDWTGRHLVKGKTGAIPKNLAPILERLGIMTKKAEDWLNLVTDFDKLFSHVVGTSQQLIDRAAQAGRRYYRGRPACAAAFG
ncbi:hypothetical protein OAS39_06600 [Pirellulales bacterium]|nr:hypothetical protein [Pirellulales bacterium]